MSLKTAFTLCGLAATAMAGVVRTGRPVQFGCGTGRPTEEFVQTSSEMRAQESELAARGNDSLRSRGGIVVNTYVHVVARDQTVAGGYLS
ncbi:hypothetical protein E4U54_000636, partial [Claviceps lovelessii]